LEPRIDVVPSRQFDVPVNILDSAKIKRETGWMPVVPFDVGIKRTWNWFYKEFNK
jgi:UDP-glucose 4-epimerase